MFVEDHTFSEAFYMTVITLSTVGFGTLHEPSELGEWCISILIIINMMIFAYSITTLSSFLIEGEFRKYLKDYRVFQKIQTLSGHVIICGYGRHGKEITREFTNTNVPFVIIERDEEQIKTLREKSKILYIEGDATNDDSLLEAGIERAKAIILTFQDDTDNLYTVLSARQLNSNLKIISRSNNPTSEQKLKRVGADQVVVPERLGGFYMASLVNKPNLVEFFTLISNMGNVQVLFEEINCERLKAHFIGHTIRDLNLRVQTGVNIIGIRFPEGNYQVNPEPDIRLTVGMKLVILGDTQQINKFKSVMLS